MIFPGYWVSGFGDQVAVSRGAFRDTELSDTSDWKRAWQNEDPQSPHGFVNPLEMLADVCRRLSPRGQNEPLPAFPSVLKLSGEENLRLLVLYAITDPNLGTLGPADTSVVAGRATGGGSA